MPAMERRNGETYTKTKNAKRKKKKNDTLREMYQPKFSQSPVVQCCFFLFLRFFCFLLLFFGLLLLLLLLLSVSPLDVEKSVYNSKVFRPIFLGLLPRPSRARHGWDGSRYKTSKGKTHTIQRIKICTESLKPLKHSDPPVSPCLMLLYRAAFRTYSHFCWIRRSKACLRNCRITSCASCCVLQQFHEAVGFRLGAVHCPSLWPADPSVGTWSGKSFRKLLRAERMKARAVMHNAILCCFQKHRSAEKQFHCRLWRVSLCHFPMLCWVAGLKPLRIWARGKAYWQRKTAALIQVIAIFNATTFVYLCDCTAASSAKHFGTRKQCQILEARSP